MEPTTGRKNIPQIFRELDTAESAFSTDSDLDAFVIRLLLSGDDIQSLPGFARVQPEYPRLVQRHEELTQYAAEVRGAIEVPAVLDTGVSQAQPDSYPQG